MYLGIWRCTAMTKWYPPSLMKVKAHFRSSLKPLVHDDVPAVDHTQHEHARCRSTVHNCITASACEETNHIKQVLPEEERIHLKQHLLVQLGLGCCPPKASLPSSCCVQAGALKPSAAYRCRLWRLPMIQAIMAPVSPA